MRFMQLYSIEERAFVPKSSEVDDFAIRRDFIILVAIFPPFSFL